MDSSDWYDLNNPRDLTPFYSQEEIDAMNDNETMEALSAIWKTTVFPMHTSQVPRQNR